MTVSFVDDFSSYAANAYGNAGPDSVRPGSGSRWSVKTSTPEITKQPDQKWRFRHASSSGAYASTTRVVHPLKAAVHFDAEIVAGSNFFAIGYGDDRTYAAMDAYTRQFGGFYISVEDGPMAGMLAIRVYHGVPTDDSGGIQTHMIYETLTSKIVGPNRFDFCVEIIESEVIIQLHSVIPGSQTPPEELLMIVTDLDAFPTGFQMQQMKYLHILSRIWMTDVIAYTPDDNTIYPLGDVDITALPFGPALGVGPADDSTGITATGEWTELTLSENLPSGADIVWSGVTFRYGPAAGEIDVARPEIRLDLPSPWSGMLMPQEPVSPGDPVMVYDDYVMDAQSMTADELSAAVLRVRSAAAGGS